jgi:hypothetical protein
VLFVQIYRIAAGLRARDWRGPAAGSEANLAL